MNWTEQAEAMMKAWTEAQKKVWEGWFELASSGMQAKPSGGPLSMEFMDPFAYVRQGIGAFSSGSGEQARSVIEQVLNSQRSTLHSLELITRAWQTVAPAMAAGTEWQGDLKKLTDRWMDQVVGAAPSVTDTADLWKSYMAEWGPLLTPWLQSVGNLSKGHLGEGFLSSTSGLAQLLSLETDGLTRMFNTEWRKEAAFDRLAELPSVGLTREQLARVAHAFDAFVDLRKAAMRYRAMTGKTMGEAVKRTMEKLTALAKEGNTINSVRELNKLWLGVADGVFSEMYVSEEYAEIQREFSSAGMKFKIEQQQVLEMLFESLNMPTRSELDDAYKTLYELRREVKALRRQLHVAQETADEVKAGSKGEPATERPSPAEAGPEEAPAAGAAES